jgi:hypothetical protein
VSVSVEVSTRGLEFEELASKLSGPLRQKFLDRLADVAWGSAFWNAPRRTGYLASTVVKDVGEGKAVIEVLAPYAKFVADGTRPHEIRPVNGRVLAFQGKGGRMVFTPLVHHPGTRANPWLKNAAQLARDRAEMVFGALWVEEVSG